MAVFTRLLQLISQKFRITKYGERLDRQLFFHVTSEFFGLIFAENILNI